MDFISNGLESLDNISKRIIDASKKTKIITFHGEIGSGKTTLIKKILYNMNVKDLVKSPTFSIINEYLTFENKLIYHFDFFRIQNEFQVLEIGFDEYLCSDNHCLIEWPEKIKNLLPSEFLKIKIKLLEDNKRQISVIKNFH